MIFKKFTCLLPVLLAICSCYKTSEIVAPDPSPVSFLSMLEGYTVLSGETAKLTAPVKFPEGYTDKEAIDKDFDVQWYIDGVQVASGYEASITIDKIGGCAVVFKVIRRATGETWLSDAYPLNSKSSVGWGWMVLSDHGDGRTSLGFVNPRTMHVHHNLERQIDGGIGTGPKSMYYYYVLGAIPNSYISGLPKILINQSSGSVTLDGSTLQKDMWLKDEFEGGREPEQDLTISGFAWKSSYYLIASSTGNIYMRCMNTSFSSIPYYGSYSSMPMLFDGGCRADYFQGFQNVSYWCADEDLVLVYDGASSRFLIITKGGYGQNYDSYRPKVVYLSYYDSDGSFDPAMRRVDKLGAGTRCLAAGAYEKVGTDESGLGLNFYPSYVALMDFDGAGDYQLLRFTVDPVNPDAHTITEASQTAFSGASLLTDSSIVRMSTNFEVNPFFYFTDGGKNLYVYSMDAGTHRLLYIAEADIVSLCSSPVNSSFAAYGGNPTDVNWRLAVALSDGSIDFLDVSTTTMVRVFEGLSTVSPMASVPGFGSIKSMVWATNYESEY